MNFLLRQQLKKARADLSRFQRQHKSLQAAVHCTHHPLIKRSQFFACYLSDKSEMDTYYLLSALWAHGKIVVVPIINAAKKTMYFQMIEPDTALIENKYGLLEPSPDKKWMVAIEQLDVMFVPLVGFDKTGNRIGMGGGFYDRYLQHHADLPYLNRPTLIGMGFNCQRVDSIEPNHWDIAMNALLTESGLSYRRL